MTGTRPVSVSFAGAAKRYGRVAAMQDLDLDIPAGRFVVLLGPSGSGKSTLVRCLAGIERLDEGTLHLGTELVEDRRHHLPPERRNLGMVFQDYALWPHLTVFDNVAYALRRSRFTGPETRRVVVEILERVGLGAHGDRYPHELSGGEQQRVALARAVVAKPGLLLFDEPLSNLDADLRERLRVEISTLSRSTGSTVVYITHDQSEAFALADDIGVLDKGRLVQFGSPEEVYHRPSNRFVARFTGLATEMPGTVVATGNGDVEVEIHGGRLKARCLTSLRLGDRVTVAVRPSAVRVVGGDTTTGAGEGGRFPPDLLGHLAGTVADVAYRGRGYEHVISFAGRLLTGCHDALRHDRGASVTVALDPAGCVAFPDGGTIDLRDRELTTVRIGM